MAENDRFERSIPRGWRGVYRRAMQPNAPPEEVGRLALRALTHMLRETHGCPGADEISHLLGEMVWRMTIQPRPVREDSPLLAEAFNRLDQIARGHDNLRNTMVAVQAAKALLLERSRGSDPFGSGTILSAFGERACHDLVDHYFFGHALEHLVEEGRFRSFAEALSWQQQVENSMSPALRSLAEHLLRHPDAAGLRVPRGTVKKEPTSTLLTESLT